MSDILVFVVIWDLVFIGIVGGLKLYGKSQEKLARAADWINIDHARKMSMFDPVMTNEAAIQPSTVIQGEVVNLSDNRISERPEWMR